MAETVGLEDDSEYAARMIAKGLSQRPDTDPLLIKALLNPNAEAPAITVQDAAHVYARDKVLNEDKDDTAQWRSWVSNTGSPPGTAPEVFDVPQAIKPARLCRSLRCARPYIRSSACITSAIRSRLSSIPTLTRTKPSVMPKASFCACGRR